MAKQDEWIRLTLRLPPALYDRLNREVETGVHSLNAEIVARLEQSLSEAGQMSQEDALAYADGVVVGVLDVLATVMHDETLDLQSFVKRLKRSANEQMKSREYNKSVVSKMLVDVIGGAYER